MQPAFIRLVANIGKQLDESSWNGRYENSWLWPEAIENATKDQVMQLRQELENLVAEANPDSTARIREIERLLSTLPTPYPGYQLWLARDGDEICIDLWEVCYQVCFRDYDVELGISRQKGFGQPASQGVEIDESLFDATGEVDWDRLDGKTRQLVTRIFANLPT